MSQTTKHPGALQTATVTLADIERAAEVLKGAVAETDCDPSRTLSSMLGCEIWLKFENLQFTASFKERGALNRLNALTPEQRAAGVIAMSAGNHAQGVAYHASRLGIPATIVMPEGTPFVKIENTRRLGAQVIVEGATLEEAAAHARDYGDRHKLTFIHPYDDPLVVAGQGTIALEMLQAVVEAADEPAEFRFLYPDEASLREKIEAVATKVYGAEGVDYDPAAARQLDTYERNGFGTLPVCIAKTHLSLSSDPALKGAPTGWRLPVREVRASVGAGFIYPICGDMRTMPGLSADPAAHHIDIDADGNVLNLS